MTLREILLKINVKHTFLDNSGVNIIIKSCTGRFDIKISDNSNKLETLISQQMLDTEVGYLEAGKDYKIIINLIRPEEEI